MCVYVSVLCLCVYVCVYVCCVMYLVCVLCCVCVVCVYVVCCVCVCVYVCSRVGGGWVSTSSTFCFDVGSPKWPLSELQLPAGADLELGMVHMAAPLTLGMLCCQAAVQPYDGHASCSVSTTID